MIEVTEAAELQKKLADTATKIHMGIETHSRLNKQAEEYDELRSELAVKIGNLTQAKTLLISVADKNIEDMLTYVSTVINKVLFEMFKDTGSGYEVSVGKTMYRNRYAQMNIKIVEQPSGMERDLKLQNGEGIRQVVSFLYTICLIELSGCRKMLVMDEVLNGLNKDAAIVVGQIMRVFTEGGFQFFMVDHGNFQVGSDMDDIIQHIEITKVSGVSQVIAE